MTPFQLRSFTGVLVIVVGVSIGLGLQVLTGLVGSQGQGEAATRLEPSDPRYRNVLCGPVSLATALGRVGVSRLPADIAAQCQVTSQGVALTDLERAAEGIAGIDACILNLNWDQLVRQRGVAVLFVNENHYLTVDPREPAPKAFKIPLIRVYEPDRPAQWWPRDKLERIWNGQALTIARGTSSEESSNGAVIEWKESFVDLGVLRNTAVPKYRFSFRNSGTNVLSIESIRFSCGCMSHVQSKDRLAPGESAVLDVNVNLQGVEGYFQQQAAVRTNDSANPVSVLRMAGGVPRPRVLSSDVIRLEDLPRGGRITTEFYVADPGFSGATIREIRFLPSGELPSGVGCTCEMSHDRIGANLPRVVATGFRANTTDHVVRLSFHATPECKVDRFEGIVNVVLETDDGITRHQVVIAGAIVPDVRPFPRVALVTLNDHGIGSTEFQLQSHAHRRIRVARIRTNETKVPLKIEPHGDSSTLDDKFVISVSAPDLVPGATPINQTIFLDLVDDVSVSLPVSIFMPPR